MNTKTFAAAIIAVVAISSACLALFLVCASGSPANAWNDDWHNMRWPLGVYVKVDVETAINGYPGPVSQSPAGLHPYLRKLYAGSTITSPIALVGPMRSIILHPDSPQYNAIDNFIFLASATPAPLPSTWTMLMAGFAGLGFFAYLRDEESLRSYRCVIVNNTILRLLTGASALLRPRRISEGTVTA
jgi:hypothetical protein